MTPVRRRSVWMALAAAGLALSGCASPTLPLPPPSEPAVGTIDSEGFVELQGGAQREAIVYAFNERLEEGVIGKASTLGAYKLRLRAQVGDAIAVWQEVGSERSSPVLVIVKK